MRVRLSIDETKLYVSNGRAGTISVLDTHSYELLDTIKVGPRPWGLGLSPDGKFLFAANGPSNDVSVVDLRNQPGGDAGQGGSESLGHRHCARRSRRAAAALTHGYFSMMNTCCSVMLRVNPSW